MRNTIAPGVEQINGTVVPLEDVLRGKMWAYRDEQRRKRTRQKDLADILRAIETHSELSSQIPPEIKSRTE